MDPTTAIPLHFTLQALALSAAGFLLAWSLVRRRWIGAVGAGLFAAAEALHAGRFLATDDEPALVVLRLVGLAALYFAAISDGTRRTLYSVGAAAVAGGTAWGAVTGGGIDDLDVGSHVLVAVGSILLGLWALLASRDSIRLRVLSALVGMLAVVVVAGGGAVSRVAAIDKRNEELRQLGSAATALRSDLADTIFDLSRRATLLVPLISPKLGSTDALTSTIVSAHQGTDLESIAIVDRSGVRAMVSAGGEGQVAYDRDQIRASSVVSAALAGRALSDYDVWGGRLVILASAPIFDTRRATVAGAVVVVRSRLPADLRRTARAYAPEAEVVLVGRTTAASDPRFGKIARPGNVTDELAFERLKTPDGSRPVAIANPRALQLVVIGSDEGIVDAATGLLRALLLAIIAAAVLAAVSALWLSARVTRPIVDLAEGAERAKTDFLSSLSHELRTPLTPIRGYTELLRKGRVPARRAADYLDEIGDAAGRLERIVTLLLDVAAQEAGRFRIKAVDHHPADLLTDAAERWKHRGRRHPVRVDAARSLPRVHADPEALSRVLDELIDNAMKFSPDGGPVELRARRAKDGVEISVADSGIGISPEQTTELMRAFAQVESGDRRRYGGLGLGLAYVAGVLTAHDTTVAVRSEADAGTALSFTLPTASMVSRMPDRASQRGSARPRT